MRGFVSNAIASVGSKKKEALKPTRACSEAMDADVCSNMSRGEGLDCPICWESFDVVENVPYVLWCGHTLCKNCVLGLHCAVLKLPAQKIRIPFSISCPWCHLLSFRLVYRGNLKFPSKNYFLLSLVESLNTDRFKAFRSFSTASQPPCSPNANFLEGQATDSNSQRVPSGGLPDVEERHGHPRHEFFDIFCYFTAKLPLVLTLLVVVFIVVPACTAILFLYLLLTVLVVLPSFLMLYLACIILGWLMRVIAA